MIHCQSKTFSADIRATSVITMGKSCMAPGCRNTQNNKSVYFHRLPLDRTILLKRWIANTKLKYPPISKHSRICSAHFELDCYERDLRAELLGAKPMHRPKEDAVPTIFDFSTYNPNNTDVPSTSGLSVTNTGTQNKERGDRLKRRSANKELLEVNYK